MEPRDFTPTPWRDVHPRADLSEAHRVTIARRIVLAAGLTLFCVAVIAVSVAAVEIASDWLHSGVRPS